MLKCRENLTFTIPFVFLQTAADFLPVQFLWSNVIRDMIHLNTLESVVLQVVGIFAKTRSVSSRFSVWVCVFFSRISTTKWAKWRPFKWFSMRNRAKLSWFPSSKEKKIMTIYSRWFNNFVFDVTIRTGVTIREQKPLRGYKFLNNSTVHAWCCVKLNERRLYALIKMQNFFPV